MNSGASWRLKGVRPEVRESAREAARRAGMSLNEWLDTVIIDSAMDAGVEPARDPRPAADDDRHPEADGGYSDFDAPPPRRKYSDYDRRHRRIPGEALAEVTDRLDALTEQIGQLARTNANPQPERGDETTRQLAQVVARLDRRLDRLADRPAPSEFERTAPSYAAEPARAPIAEPVTPLDHALAEIAQRQRALDGDILPPRTDLARAPTQDLGGLEKQLRTVKSRIDTMRPCGIDNVVETLRDDLAEIGLMIKEAMPRRAVEAIETEMRSLSERIDRKRHDGDGGTALAGLERGLTEVRDALRALTPAENLSGFDDAVRGLSQKIDRISGIPHDPGALEQLEAAIVAMRGIVSHVASNDALTKLSDEVHALAGKVDHGPSTDIIATLEQRIASIADALQARPHNGQDAYALDAVVKGLTDKLERLSLTRSDQTAVTHLEDRIANLVAKLDASDSRLSHLEAIERGLAELLIHIEHQRVPQVVAGGAGVPEVDTLKKDVRRTQDSLEAVHGTLSDVVDRLAMFETGMRQETLPKAANIPGKTPATPPRPKAAPAAAAAHAHQSPPVFAPTPAAPPAPLAVIVAAPASVSSHAPAAPGPTSQANPAPATERERRPIDPNLPPDHPLEPGSAAGARNGAPQTPAARIADSEADLGPAKPPVIPDPAGGKPNFIAAARRAAQAANTEAPARGDKRAAAAPSSAASGGNATPESALGRRVRSLLVAASVVAIVLGSIQLMSSLFSSSDDADANADRATQSAPANGGATPAPTGDNPARTETTTPPGRQSSVVPGAEGTPFAMQSAGGGFTGQLPGQMTGQATGPANRRPADQPADSLPTGTVRAPAAGTPLPTPAPARNATATPAAPTTAPAGADKLPASIGSGGLRTAAAKGDAAAEYEIAVRFAEGRGVPQDLTAAAEWFERAAKQGLVPAQFRLASLHEKGLGVRKNLDAARRLYIAAADAGHAKAMHNLAVLYAEGLDGKPDYQTASKWFRKAAEHGVSDSQYNLGILFARGIGVETNLAEAYKWFSLAARDGDKEAVRKRDDVAARLDQQTIMAARAAVQAWAPQPQSEATQVRTPAGGWDGVATPAAPKRRVGP